MLFAGYFLDGKTALRRSVQVALAPNCLRILDEGGRPLDEWPFDGLRSAEGVYKGQPVRLTHRDRGEASLTLEGQEILEPLGRALPNLRRRHYARRATYVRVVLWGSVLVLLAVGMLMIVPYLAGPLARAVPLKWQEALSTAAVEAFGGETALCSAEAGEAALGALAERLAAQVKTPYRFRVSVLKKSELNAFATPAGHIVFFQGLIESADSPEEVAGVLAHEMAHIVERHPLEGLIRALGFWVVFSLLAGEVSGAASAIGEFGQVLLTLSYSRENEAEADRVGMEILNEAGIRSGGLITFFRRLKESGKDIPGGLVFLSTHPVHEARIDAIRSLVKEGRDAMTAKEWAAVKDICGKSI